MTAPSASASVRAGLVNLPAVCESTAEDTVGAQNPDDPNAVDFSGTGRITCLDLTGKQVAKGTSVFSGTLPKLACTGLTGGYIYRATVTWADGTTTSGTYTDFTETTLNGTAAVLIHGTTAASSTKFRGWDNTVITTTVGGCGTPGDEADKVQAGVVLYVPPTL